MQEQFPLVSIIITSYNRAGSIGKAIESCLSQDYPNIEIVISDNCSADDTDSIVKKYLHDPRIKYFRNSENIGMLGNYRKATYELSKGNYITYVSSDDYLIDDSFVSDSIRIAQSDKEICLVFARMGVKNINSGSLWKYPESPYFLNQIWAGKDVFFGGYDLPLLSCCACMMIKDNLYRINAYHSEYIGFDLENNYKMMLLGKVGFINRLSYIMVGHSENNTYPTKAEKIVMGFQCYENVEKFANEKLPGYSEQINYWKCHFLYKLIIWAFYDFSTRDKNEYERLRIEVKEKYPLLYSQFMKSKEYKRMHIMNSLKGLFPSGFVHRIKRLQNRFKRF